APGVDDPGQRGRGVGGGVLADEPPRLGETPTAGATRSGCNGVTAAGRRGHGGHRAVHRHAGRPAAELPRGGAGRTFQGVRSEDGLPGPQHRHHHGRLRNVQGSVGFPL
ncbi:unnamed protein product, partial [Ectocarpus sp. 13 AM-2016]